MNEERNLGPQPVAELLAKHELTPNDLVRASTQQLTHKMVARAVKGRRLTANTMDKVLVALNTASEGTYVRADLFTYSPSRKPDTTDDSE